MVNAGNNLKFNYSEYKFPSVRPDECSFTVYKPSQTEKINSVKGYILAIIKDGKGTVAYSDKRTTLTRGNGILIPYGLSIMFKADSIEPFSIISVKISGDSMKDFATLIERRENGIILNFGNDSKICDRASELIGECAKEYSSAYGILYAFYDLLNCLDEHYLKRKIPSKNAYMTRATEYIKQNYNKNLSVENIANMLGIERSYLSRLFKTYKDKSTQNYIIDYRMTQAKRMFEEEDMNVSQVCAAVGYTNIYCFSRIFKSRVGMPPKEYMERSRKRIVK